MYYKPSNREYRMKFGTLVEMVGAAHWAPSVLGEVGEERGGMVYVAPPGNLKTTSIEVLDQFPRTTLISNITNGALNDLKQSFIAGEIKTVGFPDYDMLYKRHVSVSSQLEGTLMGLTGEGWRQAAYKDQRVQTSKARVTVVAGITIKCYEDRMAGWLDSGFARRFLWSRFWVKNMERMEEAICDWKKARLDGDFYMKVPIKPIPHCLNNAQAKRVLYELRFQPDRKLPFIFAQRMISVLCWKHGPTKGWEIWTDFAPSLGKDGADIVI